MQRIVLVRHAHAEWVADDEARPLSPQGRIDAETLVPLLVATSPAAVYSSPYARARQTVEPLSRALGLEIEEVEGLRERTLAAGAVEDFEAAMRASWDDFELVFPGGESSSAAQRRIGETFEMLAARHQEEPIVVASHGNVLGLLMNRLERSFGYEFWRSLAWPDIISLSLQSGRISMIDRLWNQP